MLKKYVVGVFIAVFCVSLSLNVLITDNFFTGFLLGYTSPEEAKIPTEELFGYFAFQNEMPEVFNEQEALHLSDVRMLLMANVLLTLVLGVLLWKFLSHKAAKAGSSVLLILVIVSSLVSFDKLFTWFHCIFFPQGNFLFPPDSTLVVFYPSAFFQNYFAAVGFFALVAAYTLCHLTAGWKN